MTSDASGNNIATPATSATDGEEGDGRVIGGRASPEDIYLIDRAALEEGMRRGPWIVKVCVDRARTVLAAKAALQGPAV